MDIIVTREDGIWWAHYAEFKWRCAIGWGGVVLDKREGDGATPAGCWPLRHILYRPDRIAAPATALVEKPTRPNDGWCDDPADQRYNQLVRLPYAARHEVLWREDEIYDVVVVLGHNDDPPEPGHGSAIFLHVAREDYAATQGCFALALPDLLELLSNIGPDSRICIEAAETVP